MGQLQSVVDLTTSEIFPQHVISFATPTSSADYMLLTSGHGDDVRNIATVGAKFHAVPSNLQHASITYSGTLSNLPGLSCIRYSFSM